MASYEKYLITIGNNEYYRRGNLFFYRSKSKIKRSRKKSIKAKEFVNILLQKI